MISEDDEYPEMYEDWEKSWGKLDYYSLRWIGCPICKHYDQEQGYRCKAYPTSAWGGIPSPIYRGGFAHVRPMVGELLDDHGIQFEPLSPAERAALPKFKFE